MFVLFVRLGNDNIHGVFAERAKIIDLVFLRGFGVACTMYEMAAGINRAQLVIWT